MIDIRGYTLYYTANRVPNLPVNRKYLDTWVLGAGVKQRGGICLMYPAQTQLENTQAVVFAPKADLTQVFHLDSLFQHRGDFGFIDGIFELVPPMERATALPTESARVIGNVDTAYLAIARTTLDCVAVRVFPNDLFRGLDDKVISTAVQIHKQGGGVLLRINRSSLCLIVFGRL